MEASLGPRTNLFGFKLSLPIEVDDQLALRVIGHGAAHPVFAIHRVLRSPLAGQLGQIGVVLPHMDTEIAALFRLVGAVGTLMRWLLAATLDILVAPECGLPAILLAAVTALVYGFAIQADAIGTGGAAIAAAAAIIAECKLQVAEGLMGI